MNNPDAKRVIRIQARLTLLAMVASVVIAGPALNVPVSALMGGLCAILPALAYVHIAGAVHRVSPAELMRAHYKAEAVKFVLTLLLFGGALAFFKDLSVAGLFGGYIAATSAYWFGLLIKN